MLKCLLVALLLFACAVNAGAQDEMKTEVFLGYSYLHLNSGIPNVDRSAAEGMNLDATYYPWRNFGMVADFQWHQKNLDFFQNLTTIRLFSLHGGPRVKLRRGKFEPFANALFGFTHGSVDQDGPMTSDTQNAFSMKLGGGLDIAGWKHIAVRLGELNYYYTRFDFLYTNLGSTTDHQNSYTYSGGIVIRF
jgi:opacity protein-like surface antigen